MSKTVLITGANRGLGLETARQLLALGWTVGLAARRLDDARAAAEQLGGDCLRLALDVTQATQAHEVAARLQEEWGGLDCLVNNAGAVLQGWGDGSVLSSEVEVVARTFDVNAMGALRVTQAMLPMLLARRGVIVNVSSGMGGVTEMGGGQVGYRLSKASLNALTRILHAEHAAAGLRVNSVCPGWVRTELGGPQATLSVEEGARGIVWAATLGPEGPSGGFWRHGEAIAF